METPLAADFAAFSLTPLLIGALAAVACALPGNFLLLRGQALVGDAISHVVLPGIVGTFLITGAIATWPMLLGAAAAALAAAGMIEAIKRLGRIEPGAAMGVTFTTLFAAGVFALEQSGAGAVHLDDHALYGNLESLIWPAALERGLSALADPEALAGLPPELPRIAAAALLIAALTWLFWRPLKISTFDEGFARTLGMPVRAIGLGLVALSAVAAVAAFDAVGSILVIAMFICPPAAARLMTDRLERQVLWSVAFAIASAVFGYLAAGYGPLAFGGRDAVSAAGMIAVVSGLILAAACLFGPCRARAAAPPR